MRRAREYLREVAHVLEESEPEQGHASAGGGELLAVRREPGLRVNAFAMCVNTFLAAPFIALEREL